MSNDNYKMKLLINKTCPLFIITLKFYYSVYHFCFDIRDQIFQVIED